MPTLRPSLKVGGVHIANPPGFSQPEFASLGEARLQIDLPARCAAVVRVHEIGANEVRARFEQSADGRAQLGLRGRAPPQGHREASAARPT